MAWPDFTAWLDTAWGAGQEFSVAGGMSPWGVGNLTPRGINPPYTLDDLAVMYPKFFGHAVQLLNCTTTAGSNTVAVQSTTGLAYGQFIQASGALPAGLIITGLGTSSITVNQAALTSSTAVTVLAYTAPPVPAAVVQVYINLATASLKQNLYQDSWLLAMSLFVAHYLTLWAETDGPVLQTAIQNVLHGEQPVAVAGDITGTQFALSAAPPGGQLSLYRNGQYQTAGTAADYSMPTATTLSLNVAIAPDDALYATWFTTSTTSSTASPTASQVAAQGLATGILTSKSVGDVSAGYTVLESLKEFGAWQLTRYGQQLATLGKVIGSGPMVLW
jgi:hypothetical protein